MPESKMFQWPELAPVKLEIRKVPVRPVDREAQAGMLSRSAETPAAAALAIALDSDPTA